MMILVAKAYPGDVDDTLACLNHPSAETRVRCGSCDKPICVKCMRESPVGMKCTDCARLPRRAVRIGKPRHYLAAGGASLATAALLGAVLSFFSIPLFGFLLPILAGYVIGSVSRRASGGLGLGIIQAVTAIAAVAGLTVGRVAVGVPLSQQIAGRFLFGTVLVAVVAAVTVSR